MLKKEEIESWNNILPNCKINEEDLAHPTEQFLTRVLCAYLQKFGYKVHSVDMGADLLHETRFFLIKLVRHIDYILKISHKSYTFTYFDLINPTRKRTSITLSILLNYMHYYNMYQMDTLGKTNERLQIYNQLKETYNQIQSEIQKNKADAKKLYNSIMELRGKKANLQAEIANVNEDVNKINKKLDILKANSTNLQKKVNELHTQTIDLRAQVVTNEEVESLQQKIKEQMECSENLKQTKKNLDLQTIEMNEFLHKHQKLLEQLELASQTAEQCQTTLLALLDANRQLSLKVKHLAGSEEKKKEMEQQIALNKQSFETLRQNWQEQRQQMEAQIDKFLKSIEDGEIALKTLQDNIKATEEQIKQVEFQWQEETALEEYLEEHIAVLTLELHRI